MSSTLSLSRCLTRSLAAQELFCLFCCSATIPLKILSNSVCDVAGTVCSSAVFFWADKCPIHLYFVHETLEQSQTELLFTSSSCSSVCGFWQTPRALLLPHLCRRHNDWHRSPILHLPYSSQCFTGTARSRGHSFRRLNPIILRNNRHTMLNVI